MKKVFLLSLIAFYVHAQTLYFNNYDSLGKNDKVVTNATFEGLATTTMVSEAVSSLVPTNRTITVGNQVGSLETNLVFASSADNVTKLYNPSNAQAWAEIKGDSVYVYAPGPSVTFSSDFGSSFGPPDTRIQGKTFKHPVEFDPYYDGYGALIYSEESNAYTQTDDGGGANYSFSSESNTWYGASIQSVGFAVYSPTGILHETVYSLDAVASDTNKVDKTTTLTINGRTWALSSNGVFTIRTDYVDSNNGTATNLSVSESLDLFGKKIMPLSDYGTLGLYLGNGVTNFIGADNTFFARNGNVSQIQPYKIVYTKGGVGGFSRIEIASNTNGSMKNIAIVCQTNPVTAFGYGYVSRFNPYLQLSVPTNVYQSGDNLWLSTSGNYTNAEPYDVSAKWHLGFVVSSTGGLARVYFDPRYIPNAEDVGAVNVNDGTATNLSVFSSLNLFDHIITWNSDRQTFDVPLFGGVVGQLFQEQLLLVRNQTGANIANGKIVCSAGAVGDNAAIRKASSSDASCAWGVLGMVTQDAGIDHGSNGLICTSGEVNNLPLPTSIYQPSNTLWLTTDGNYTNVEPQNVAVKYQIGIVLRAHASQGRILLNPQYIAPDRITSQSIIRDIVTSTNVVRVTSTQSVYVATVTSPCVITQDVSALTLATNQTAFWTTRINVKDWSATNGVTFATNIAAYAGGFTVTGCYDFACSLLCDGRIEMRQTFPTVKHSVPVMWNVQFGGSQNILAQSFITATIRTNAVGTYRSKSSDYIISTFTFMGTALTNITSAKLHARALNLASYTGVDYALPKPRSTPSGYIMRLNCSSGNFATDGFTNLRFSADSGYSVGIELTAPIGTGDIYLTGVEQRDMNELEIQAYITGWRPQ